MTIKIQTTFPSQFAETVALEQLAFATADHSDGDEQNLVTRMRQANDYEPDFDIVAIDADQDKIVGHAMLSKIIIAGKKRVQAVALAPIAIHPDYQKQGIGGKLITELENRAITHDMPAVSVLGDLRYYHKFGYGMAGAYKIHAPFQVPAEFFLIKEIIPNGLRDVTGTIYYSSAFGM